jgi:hypothetical protein
MTTVTNNRTAKLTIICADWRPLQRNTLLGFARIRISELGLTIHEVAIHQKGEKMWAQLPSKPWVRDGQLVTGDDGKLQYSPVLEFDRREVREAFSQRAAAAVIAAYPRAFAEAAA